MSKFKVGDQVAAELEESPGAFVYGNVYDIRNGVAVIEDSRGVRTAVPVENLEAPRPWQTGKHRDLPRADQPIRLSGNQLWEIGNVIHALTEHGDNDSFDRDNTHVSFGDIPVHGEDYEPIGTVVMNNDTGEWVFEVAQ